MARGDQIYTQREFWNLQGLYEHHGIDCGDGTVIHYRKPSETVEQTSLATFAGSQPIYVKPYRTAFIPEVAVQRAESRLGERRYNLLFNNCEHFATWCKTGISSSQQVNDFLPLLATLKTEELETPVQEALQDSDQDSARVLVQRALGQIEVVWNDLQPRYKRARAEAATWERVAQEAVQRDRDDLARAALTRKRQYRQEAEKLEAQLQQLATLTERVLRQKLQAQ
ncbi:MAG: NC domain-containing protein [Spirulinaceae cyanobacterium RM2_2_10]|nr:NC domain-containing protein [Spirulinaceae cyanobacterium SM2_1_0]NJO20070.1 NC domain-containing protein [Spirulinaceae cyanobacterium RM2_2_10]